MKRYSAKIPLDAAYVKKLRKDFLLLMRNAKVVKNYDQAKKWRDYVRKWTDKLEDYAITRLPRTLSNLRYQKKITESDQKYWDEKLRSDLWALIRDFRVPLGSYEFAQKYTPWKTKEYLFEEFKKELKKWEGRVRRRSRTAWKTLKDFIEWASHKLTEEVQVEIPLERQVKIEGFNIVLRGAESSSKIGDYLARLRESLRHYKKRAERVLPLLLRAQLPMVIDFTGSLGKGGRYERTFIWLNPLVLYSDGPKEFTEIISHEMGHHLYENYLSSKDKEYWGQAVSGNYKNLDLREVVKEYGDQTFLFENKKMKAENPILYLQVQGLYHQISSKDVFDDILTMKALKDYLQGGGQAIWKVHGKPITGYAHKNHEEAFCEAVGYLVAFGPQALLPEVRWWLRRILPTVRV